jgi:UDPglucose 6-dehydrogenase
LSGPTSGRWPPAPLRCLSDACAERHSTTGPLIAHMTIIEREPIGVVGVGWVGLITAACFAELGHEVIGRDVVPEKVAALRRGDVPIHEAGLPELLRKNETRLHFTTSIEEVLERTRVLFCCVDTPPTRSGDADLSRIESVVDELAERNSCHILVMKSTVPVGTGRSIQRRRRDVAYVSNPEFLKEGSAVRDFMTPDRVVIGADAGSDYAADEVEALYAPLGANCLRTDVASAEMIKLASNAFLATKISFINEIANVSEELGADVALVAEGMGMDARIGSQFLRAGIGWGGSCFGKDVLSLKQLAANSGYHFQLLTAVDGVNELQKRRTIGKLEKHLGSLVGKEIALLGMAFKPHTDDIRDAPSMILAGRLRAEGARVRAYDPVAADRARRVLSTIDIYDTALEAVDGADAVVLVTEWPEFRALDWVGDVKPRLSTPLVVDGRNFLDGDALVRAGFMYEGIGRAALPRFASAANEHKPVAA